MNIGLVGQSSLANNIDTRKIENIKGENGNFSQILGDTLGKVNDLQVTADNKVESLIKGDDIAIHDVMLSMQEAQMSMQLLIEARNKVVEAYQEVNRLQL